MKIGKLFDGMLLLASLVCMTLLGSCEKGIGEDESKSREPGVYDLTVSDVEMFGAKLKANVTLPEQMGMDFELGFEVSESNTFPKESTKRYKVENFNPDNTFTYNVSGLYYGTYYVRAYMINKRCLYTSSVKSFEFEYKCPVPGPNDCVDLGLSVKWAPFNVGATKSEEHGDYFAWGETKPKSSSYDWSTYKYCKGSENTMTKYCTDSRDGYNGFTDNKTVLDPDDDAAHVNWGGDWRMPTKSEFEEFSEIENCTWTWTTINGVNGYKIVSKKTGFDGNWIFLPAAGYREGTNQYIGGFNRMLLVKFTL